MEPAWMRGVLGASGGVGWLEGQAGGLFESRPASLRSPGARSPSEIRTTERS